MMLFSNDFKLFIPDFFLTFNILFLLMIGAFLKKGNSKISLMKPINDLSLEILIFMIILILNHPYYQDTIFNNIIMLNNFTLWIKLIISISTLCIICMSYQYEVFEKLNTFELSILILLSVFGMSLLCSSRDLMMIYLAIELQSLSFYILASLKRDSQFSTEAGLKYFILGSLSSGFLLFGCSAIYLYGRSTNLEYLNNFFTDSSEFNSTLYVGMIFIMAALLFKMAAAPFHMWAPDVYEGSPTIITAFFAIVPKIAILSVLIPFLFESFYEFQSYWQSILMFCSISSMILGAIGAIEQKKIKRFLAYSSIGHVGYLLLGLTSGSLEGLQAVIIYVILYMIMSINIFSIILCLYKKNDLKNIIYIKDFTGLSKENPILAIIFSIMVLSMAGIPPLAGFISKLHIFYSAMASSLYGLAIIGVLTSVLGAVYYLRFVKIIYFENNNSFSYVTLDIYKSIIISVTFLIILFFIINPSYILILSHHMALQFSI